MALGTMLADAMVLIFGAWLLFYRLMLQSGLKPVAEVLTTIVSGASLALLAPFMPWPPPPFSVLTLAVIGALLSSCTPFCGSLFSAILLALTLGVGCAGFIWQLGACKLSETIEVPFLHGILATLTSIIFVIVFVCTPGIAGPNTLKVVMAPCLGALLFTVGLAGVARESSEDRNFGLTPSELLAEEPCDPGNLGNVEAFVSWLLVSVCGVVLQLVLLRAERKAEPEERGSLVSHLLPQAQDTDIEGKASIPRPDEMAGDDRYAKLRNAIFAPPDADLSHLSESERKIVEICRKDEFERDRLLWGGGLQ